MKAGIPAKAGKLTSQGKSEVYEIQMEEYN